MIFRFLSLILLIAAPLSLQAQTNDNALREALRLVSIKEWGAARSAVAHADEISSDLIEWHRLRGGDEAARLGDYEAFLLRHPDWPGLALLRQKGEVAVARSTDPARVIAYFGTEKPATGQGAVALVTAFQLTGRPGDAEAEAYRAWAILPFTAEEETALLALQSEALQVAHEVRLDNLLWDGDRSIEVARMLPRVSQGWRDLAGARAALRADKPGASALIDKLPETLREDAGLGFERFIWRMRKSRYDDAAALILERSTSAATLGRPALWAERRALLARWLMRKDNAKTAYRVAASHHLAEGEGFVDLEFLSGFIALRKLGDADRALDHFTQLAIAVKTPISLARAAYWQGRALEAKGDAAGAKAAYARAAQHQTAYYGLLAAEKLGLSLTPDLIDAGPPTQAYKTASFADSSALAAGRLLLRLGDRTTAKRFFVKLSEGQDAAGYQALADLALRLDEPHLALIVAKQAAEKAIILPRSYYPTPAMVPEGLAVSRALALSISRRESEFDPAAQSHAGARGLMQLLPETAARMSRDLGLEPSTSRLTTDPAYNATLGAAYLSKMIEEFGPSIALIASGYNAGPGRPRKWVQEFGDPRTGDVVDWVETIPFAETRTYVMRVAEGVVIYRARLKGQSGPVRITAELRGQ
jgi:soluble lytic murein transglycosylase